MSIEQIIRHFHITHVSIIMFYPVDIPLNRLGPRQVKAISTKNDNDSVSDHVEIDPRNTNHLTSINLQEVLSTTYPVEYDLKLCMYKGPFSGATRHLRALKSNI